MSGQGPSRKEWRREILELIGWALFALVLIGAFAYVVVAEARLSEVRSPRPAALSCRAVARRLPSSG